MISLHSELISQPLTSDIHTLPLAVDAGALRVAAQLRSIRGKNTGAMSILFTPATPLHDVRGIVREVGQGLQQLQEGPVVAVELFPQKSASEGVEPIEVPLEPDSESISRAWAHLAADLGPNSLTYARVGLLTGSGLPVAERLSLFLSQAKRAFRFVLLSGQDLHSGVESLLAAPLSDGVVLCAAKARTTNSELARAKTTIHVAQAKALGFVLDETPRFFKSRP